MIEVVLVYVAPGVFAGVVAAMFGVGGGFAVAPLLLLALTVQNIGGDYTMHLTVGTTLAVIFITASYSAVLRWRAGDTNFPLIMRFAPLVVIVRSVAPLASKPESVPVQTTPRHRRIGQSSPRERESRRTQRCRCSRYLPPCDQPLPCRSWRKESESLRKQHCRLRRCRPRYLDRMALDQCPLIE